ncbi:hypothetical protein [uncultured Limnobacter sp.]|uniref:hypothetical protein n=1 Tax=uncultured Limnobacter sp. TaxID=199681 RepID=UPI0030FC266A
MPILYILLLLPFLTLSGCAIVGPKLDFYDSALIAKEPNRAIISGSKTQGQKPLSPILIYMDSIDKKVTGRAKEQRCSFNKSFPVSPGKHELVVVIAAGESFASSRFGFAALQVNALPNAKLILKGEVSSDVSAKVWAQDSNGSIVTEQVSVTLGDSPSKGMPIGFAALEDSCSLP